MRKCVVPALVLLFAACDRSVAAKIDSSPPVVSVGESWTVDSLEFMRVLGVTTVDSLVPFTDVKGVARLPNGGVVVADGSSSTLKFFNAEGEYAHTAGERGSGRFEISRLTHLMKCGDSLYVRDLPQYHYKIFTKNGVGVRTFALPADSAGTPAEHSMCNAAGMWVNYSSASPRVSPSASQATRVAVPFWLSSTKGKTVQNLGNHPGREQWFAKYVNAEEYTDLPMGRETFVAIGRARAYIGSADSFAINVYALDGSPLGAIHKQVRVHSITPDDVARYKLRDTSGRPAADVARQVKQWAGIEFPKMSPAYTAFVVDSADNLWVRALPPSTDEWVEWYVFSPDGKEIAHTSMPQSFRVFEIGSDWVLGVDVDPETRLSVVKSFTLRRMP